MKKKNPKKRGKNPIKMSQKHGELDKKAQQMRQGLCPADRKCMPIRWELPDAGRGAESEEFEGVSWGVAGYAVFNEGEGVIKGDVFISDEGVKGKKVWGKLWENL
jgi:hypothetical protein